MTVSAWDWCELPKGMETVQANLKVSNKGQFERFTVRNLPNFHLYTSSNSKALKLALIGQFGHFQGRLPHATHISHMPEQS